MSITAPKILVIRFSSIGDIVLTSPVLRCIKQDLPNATIHFLTKPANSAVLNSNPFIDKLLFWDERKTVKELKESQYDFVIDLHRNLRTQRIKWGLRLLGNFPKWHAFNKINWAKMLTVWTKQKAVLPKKHIVERYMKAVAPLGVKYDDKGLDFFIAAQNKVAVSESFEELNAHEYYVYVIGGQHTTKKLPLKKQLELLAKINKKVILLGGKEDAVHGELLVSMATNCVNACGKFNLQQSASIIEQSRKVITHDTGLMHIAAAFLKPLIVIWGNTIPEFGMYPFYPKGFHDYENVSLEVDVFCRPCSKIGYKSCPWGHFSCMNNQSFDRVV